MQIKITHLSDGVLHLTYNILFTLFILWSDVREKSPKNTIDREKKSIPLLSLIVLPSLSPYYQSNYQTIMIESLILF